MPRRAQSVPIGLGELEAVSQHYPILFTSGAAPHRGGAARPARGREPVRAARRHLAPGRYVPAYVRAFPFIFVEDDGQQDALCRHGAGRRLPAPGRRRAAVRGRQADRGAERERRPSARPSATTSPPPPRSPARWTPRACWRRRKRTSPSPMAAPRACAASRSSSPSGSTGVSDETFLDWRRRGWLGPLYAHLHSMARWSRLIELAAPPVPRRTDRRD